MKPDRKKNNIEVIADLTNQLGEANRKNSNSRYIIACLASCCIECGRDKMSVGSCPAGFPGCAYADDMNLETPELAAFVKRLRGEN